MTGSTRADGGSAKQMNVDESLLTDAPVWAVVDSEGDARLYQERPNKKLMPGDAFFHGGEIFELSLTEPRHYPEEDVTVDGVSMVNIATHEEYRFEPIADIRRDLSDAIPLALVS